MSTSSVPTMAVHARTRSNDTMFRGRVTLQQHQTGYRFSIDPVLLSHFTSRLRPSSTLDMGTGCGVLPLLLADLWSERTAENPRFHALEVQPALCSLAEDNIVANKRDEQIEVRLSDVRDQPQTERRQWRIVTCNPPYYRANSGSKSEDVEKAVARHECHGSLEELLTAGAFYLHSRGHLTMVYPSEGFPRLIRALQRVQLHITRLQWVHATAEASARLVLLVARFRATPLQVESPIFLYEKLENRAYTTETDALLNGIPLLPFG